MNLNNTHKEIPLTLVTQGNSEFYTAVVDIKDFANISTISAAGYIMNKFEVEDYEKSDLVYQTLSSSKAKGYQRQRESADKINQIATYIKESNAKTEHHLFEDFDEFQKPKLYHVIPNAILLATKAIRINDIVDTPESNNSAIEEEIIIDHENSKLYISLDLIKKALENPENDKYKKFFIIDGYHRLLGFQKYVENNPQSTFQFVASFLINRELEEEAEIFTTVNKTATKVDTSYYYHVVGEFEIGQREHIYLHNIARYYNELENSIFQNKIKMLGKKDPNVSFQPLSQAFFIEQIYNCLMKDKGFINIQKFIEQGFPKRVPLLRYYLISQNNSKIARTLLLNYFNAINDNMKKFNIDKEADQYFFLKTLPFGALVLIFPVFYFSILATFLNENQNNGSIKQESDEFEIEPLLRKIDLFSTESFKDVTASLFTPIDMEINSNAIDNDIVSIKVPWLYYEYKTNFTNASSQGLLNQFAKAIFDHLEAKVTVSLQDIQTKYYTLYNLKVGGKPIAVKI